jgi:hypothetical protein
MRGARLLILVSLIVLSSVLISPSSNCGAVSASATACCKYCVIGKACGNTCISRAYTCHVGPGCACNAYELPTPAATMLPQVPY